MSNLLWQRSMIALARSKRLSHFIQNNAFLDSFSRRFVGGKNQKEALERAHALSEKHIKTSAFYLGEYIPDPESIENNVQQILDVIETFAENDAELHVSIDPTQVGYVISDELGWQNALRIGRALASKPTARFLMVDMEDYSYLEKTLDLYYRLRDEGIPVAITLQAYLFRTADDLEKIMQQPANVRLVKGAFAEGSQIAWTKKADVEDNFLKLADMMLQPEKRELGVYPIFATHDPNTVAKLEPIIKANGWKPDQYEFEMLLGVRESLENHLMEQGHAVRLYAPFGSDWWAYSIRRVGENPANARFVLRALFGR